MPIANSYSLISFNLPTFTVVKFSPFSTILISFIMLFVLITSAKVVQKTETHSTINNICSTILINH
ncbi:Uncharacterised protein [Segatella copri]|nr:Uncharacterised protein [Segatella copri]